MGAGRVPGPIHGSRHAELDGTTARIADSALHSLGVGRRGSLLGHICQRSRRQPRRATTRDDVSTGSRPIRIVTLDVFLFHGVHRDPTADLGVASGVFAPCHVDFNADIWTVSPEASRELIGADRRIYPDTSQGSEMDRIVSELSAELRRGGRIKVFYVPMIVGVAGYSVSAMNDFISAVPRGERVFVADGPNPTTLAHELGHVLLDQRTSDHRIGTDYIMSNAPLSGERGWEFTPEERQRIYDNAA